MAVIWIDVIAGEFLKAEDERDWNMFGEFAKQAPKTAAHFSRLNNEAYYLLSCLRGVKAKDMEKIVQETPFVCAIAESAITNDAITESNDSEPEVNESKEEKHAKKAKKEPEPEQEPEPDFDEDDDDDDDDDFDFDFD